MDRKATDLILEEVKKTYLEIVRADDEVGKLYSMANYLNTLVKYGMLDFIADYSNTDRPFYGTSFYKPDGDILNIPALQETIEKVFEREKISDFPPPLQNINVPNSVKFREIIKLLLEKTKVNPISTDLTIFPESGGFLKHLDDVEELINILQKLEQDYKLIEITGNLDWQDDDLPQGGYYWFNTEDPYHNHLYIRILPAFISWAENFLSGQHIIEPQTENIYRITYTPKREILLNNLLLIGKPDLDSENDNVFNLLYANPNKKFTVEQINAELKSQIKPLSKIVENLGFRKDLRKMFFEVSSTSILFRNPITEDTLKELGIHKLDLRKL